METLTSKRWIVAPRAPADFVGGLQPLHPLVSQVLYNRGLADPAAAGRFLDRTPPLDDPFDLPGVADAVALIRDAVSRGDPIVVYGDYDVDGVTAAAVLVETLGALGATVKPYIPSREDEGYGLNPEAIAALAQEGARLLITVDCGIRSLADVVYAHSLGLRIVVTDHHQLGSALPDADAVINPKRVLVQPDYDGRPVSDLAAVGVAFKLAQALLQVNRQSSLATTERDLDESVLLDLVALGTVADMVALVGENHTLVSRGLEQLNSAHRPGLSALMRVAGVTPGKITTKTIGFVLSPRLNAAGRLDEAMTALELLLAPDMASALPLAHDLEALNQRRREITMAVREKAEAMLHFDDGVPPLIFAASDEFPPGVVGLAASRLLDDYYRPAVVVSKEDPYSKGSARSIPEFDVTQALDSLDGLLERHGGHAAAAGFTVRTSRLPELESRLLALAEEKLGDLLLVPTLRVDAETPLQELSWDVHDQLEQLQPFGFGNPVPIFVSRRVRIMHARAVGNEGRHLKMYVADDLGRSWDAIAFRQGHWEGRLSPVMDLAYILELNEWNGRTTLQLNVQDIQSSDGVRPLTPDLG